MVDRSRVALICIEKMLEAWLLADNVALEKVLGRREHPIHINRVRHPDRVRDPKAALNKLFQENGHGRYTGHLHGQEIAAQASTTALRRIESFVRFESKLRGV